MTSLLSPIVCLVLAGAAAPLEYTSDFGRRSDGDKATDHWECMTPTWSIQDHAFVQSDATLYGTYAFLRDKVFTDFTTTVKFQVATVGAGVRSPGIAFRSRNGSEGYYVQFDAANSQVLLQVMRPGQQGEEAEMKRVRNVPLAADQWYEAAVEAKGRHIRVTLDNKLVLEADDATYAAGRIGLRAGQGRVAFKDFCVKGAEGTLDKPWTMQPLPSNMQGVGQSPVLLQQAERVVAAEGQGYFPVMIRLQDGSLGAVIRGGATHLGLGGRLDFIRSGDGGKTWSKPIAAIDSEWDDRNPALGQMPDGTLVIAYGEAHSYRPDGTFDLAAGPYLPFLVTSSDGGCSWSPKRPFTAPWPNASPYGKIAVCKSGVALLSIYQMPSNAMGILRSKDNGKTWGDYSAVPGAHDETQVTELPDGRLMAFSRMDGDRQNGLWLSESDDRGYTWVRSRKLLKAQQWPFDATVLASGRLLVSYGSRVSAGRFGFGIMLSDDLGRTWGHSVLLGWDSLNGDTGYPSTVQLADGTIATMYYAVGTAASPATQAIVIRTTEEELMKAMPQ